MFAPVQPDDAGGDFKVHGDAVFSDIDGLINFQAVRLQDLVDSLRKRVPVLGIQEISHRLADHLLAGEPRHLASLLIAIDVAPLFVHDLDPVPGLLEQGAVCLLGLAQRLFGPLLDSDVAIDSAGPDDPAPAVFDGGVGNGHLDRGSVLSPANLLDERNAFTRADLVYDFISLFLVPHGIGMETGDVPAQHLLLGVAVDRFRPGVPGGDPPFRVQGDDSVRCAADDAVEPLACIPHL